MEFTNVIYKIERDRTYLSYTNGEQVKKEAEQNAQMECTTDWEDALQIFKMIARTEHESGALNLIITEKAATGNINVEEVVNEFFDKNFHLIKDVILKNEFIYKVIKNYVWEYAEAMRRMLKFEEDIEIEVK